MRKTWLTCEEGRSFITRMLFVVFTEAHLWTLSSRTSPFTHLLKITCKTVLRQQAALP
jgi:hypothetical protein